MLILMIIFIHVILSVLSIVMFIIVSRIEWGTFTKGIEHQEVIYSIAPIINVVVIIVLIFHSLSLIITNKINKFMW